MKSIHTLSTITLLILRCEEALAFQSLLKNDVKRSKPSAIDSSELFGGVQSMPVPLTNTPTQNIFQRENGAKRDQDKPRLPNTIPCGQNQLPLLTRIAKALFEESQIWVVSFTLPLIASLAVGNNVPLLCQAGFEFMFLAYCSEKVLNKLNIPSTPEPLIPGRSWEDVTMNMWASLPDTKSRIDCVMGWFYDVPFERLRMEDALSYVAWLKYGLPLEYGVLTDSEIDALCEFDLPILLENINQGKALPKRKSNEKPLPFIRFNCEPLRYRHKPLAFYGIMHGVKLAIKIALEKIGFTYVQAENPETDLSYWYKLPTRVDETETMNNKAQSERSLQESRDPLVCMHGVGGPGFCYQFIADLQEATLKDDVPIIFIDLPHVSLLMYNEIPKIKSQVESIFSIIDKVAEENSPGEKDANPSKATLIGHSFGTAVMSWMVQSNPERIAGCVFIDPICFQIHLKTLLFNFHFQRVDEKLQNGVEWENPFSLGSLVNLAGTEMHTNYAMLRQFSWATNALWPEDLVEKGVKTSVILSENDEIIPVQEVEELMQRSRSNGFLDTFVFDGAGHGDMFFDDDMRAETVDRIMKVVNDSQRTKDTELWDFSNLKSLFPTSYS